MSDMSETSNLDSTIQVSALLMPSDRLHARNRRVNDVILTTLLETNLSHLDDLRATLERTNRKNIDDVREVNGWGADLLRGVEGRISYADLLRLIREFRDGIAHRRVAALQGQA